MSDRGSVKRAPAPGLLENVFEDFPDAVVITSASGEIVAANRQTETMFGYARAELLGLPVETLIPERRRPIDAGHPESYSPETQVLPTGIGLDRYGKRKDGSEFPVDTSLSPLGMADGGGALRVVR
ncbi:MAG: PAS domain-containing protein, partial [Candidatus Acidiferrales bacterium]